MASNTLEPGEARAGWVSAHSPGVPDAAALLQNQDGKMVLTIPFGKPELEIYQEWFKSDLVVSIPARPSPPQPMPRQLTFRDSRGRVGLAGCRRTATTSLPFGGLGEGRITADFAILDASSAEHYAEINGLRSTVPGLATWMSLRSLQQSLTHENGRIKRLDLTLESPAPIKLADEFNLTVRPSFSMQHHDETDVTEIRERMFIETRTANPSTWHQHLLAHSRLLDLLNVSAWRGFHFTSHSSLRDDDQLRTLDGQTHGDTWRKVLAPASRRTKPGFTAGRPVSLNHLFTFADIGVAGIGRWLAMRETYERGINPLLAVLYQSDLAIESAVMQSGVGIEALGFQLALESGKSEREAGREHFYERLNRVLDDADALPPEAQDASWVQKISDSYNAVKHANRQLPDPLDLANVQRECVLVFRFWVASRLGVPAAALEQSLARDPMREAYRAAE